MTKTNIFLIITKVTTKIYENKNLILKTVISLINITKSVKKKQRIIKSKFSSTKTVLEIEFYIYYVSMTEEYLVQRTSSHTIITVKKLQHNCER